jgi:hypothetical protein
MDPSFVFPDIKLRIDLGMLVAEWREREKELDENSYLARLALSVCAAELEAILAEERTIS